MRWNQPLEHIRRTRSKFKPILTLTVKKKWNKTLRRTALVLECLFLGTKMQKSRCKRQTRVYLCNVNAETVGIVTQLVACLAGEIVFARVLVAKPPYKAARSQRWRGEKIRLLPILCTTSQLLFQHFPRAEDPAGSAGYSIGINRSCFVVHCINLVLSERYWRR